MGYSYNFNPSYPYQRPQSTGVPIGVPLARPGVSAFPLYSRPVSPPPLVGFSAPRLNTPINGASFPTSGGLAPLPGLPTPSQVYGPTTLPGKPQAGYINNATPSNAASVDQKPQIQNHYYTVNSGKEPSSKKKNIKKFLLTTGAVMTGMVATVALGFLGLRIAYPQKFKAFKLIDEEVVKCVNSGIEVWNKTNSKNPINKGMKSFEAFIEAYKNRPKKVDQPVGYIGRLWNAFLNKQEPVVQQMASEVEASAETGLKLPSVIADPWVKINTAIDDMVDASKLFKQVASGMQTDFESVGPGLKQALEQTNALLDSVQPGVQNFNSTFENAAKSAKQLDSLLTQTKPQVEEAVANVKSASKAAIDVMSQTQGVMKKAEGAITEATGHIGETTAQAKSVMQRAEGAIAEATGHMGETAKQAQATLKEVKKGVTKTTGQLGHIAAHTHSALTKVEKGVTEATGHMDETAKQAQASLKEVKKGVTETTGQLGHIAAHTHSALTKVEKGVTEATGHMGETAKQAQATLKEVKKGVTKTTGQLGHIAAHTHSALTKVEKGVTEATGHMDEAAKKALPAMVEAANHARDLSARANTVTNPLSWFSRGSKKVDSPTDEVFHEALESLPENA